MQLKILLLASQLLSPATAYDLTFGLRDIFFNKRQQITVSTSSVLSPTTHPSNTPTPSPNPPKIHTGFSYGAFYPPNTPKLYADFHRLFTLARSLPNLPTPFTTARLYQTAQWNAPREPSSAFRAAIDTNTSLLLGLWLPLDDELAALDAAFATHGQRLADLVVGISVGNEDVYRGSEECTRAEGRACPMGASADEVARSVARVKEHVRTAAWRKYFKTPPPVGHADTAHNAVVDGADFVGANVFPYWHGDGVESAWDGFQTTLKDVEARAKGRPLWVTETGWPARGLERGSAKPGPEAMQRYWREVGCRLFGRVSTFWFQLERDSHDAGDLDWGLVDRETGRVRIADLSCPGWDEEKSESISSGETKTESVEMKSESKAASTPTAASASPPAPPPPTSSKSRSSAQSDFHWPSPIRPPPTPKTTHSSSSSLSPYPNTTYATYLANTTRSPPPSTTHTTLTSTITVAPPPPPPSTLSTQPRQPNTTRPTPSPAPPSTTTVTVTEITACVTVSLNAAGATVTVATKPPVGGSCLPPGAVPTMMVQSATTSSTQTQTQLHCITISGDAVGGTPAATVTATWRAAGCEGVDGQEKEKGKGKERRWVSTPSASASARFTPAGYFRTVGGGGGDRAFRTGSS